MENEVIIQCLYTILQAVYIFSILFVSSSGQDTNVLKIKMSNERNKKRGFKVYSNISKYSDTENSNGSALPNPKT